MHDVSTAEALRSEATAAGFDRAESFGDWLIYQRCWFGDADALSDKEVEEAYKEAEQIWRLTAQGTAQTATASREPLAPGGPAHAAPLGPLAGAGMERGNTPSVWNTSPGTYLLIGLLIASCGGLVLGASWGGDEIAGYLIGYVLVGFGSLMLTIGAIAQGVRVGLTAHQGSNH